MSAVIVTLPPGLSSEGVEIAVTIDDDSAMSWELGDVLIRPAHSTQMWQRLQAVGGTVQVRP